MYLVSKVGEENIPATTRGITDCRAHAIAGIVFTST